MSTCRGRNGRSPWRPLGFACSAFRGVPWRKKVRRSSCSPRVHMSVHGLSVEAMLNPGVALAFARTCTHAHTHIHRHKTHTHCCTSGREHTQLHERA
eukprot:6751290-Alexandrium_andersonii.AAC.1